MLQEETLPIITSFRIAYSLGFSDSLSMESYSGRADMARYEFEKGKERKMHKAYLRGWSEGYASKILVRRELLEAGVIFSD